MGWIKISELPQSEKAYPDVVVTLIKGKVFAYSKRHNIRGLREVIKHHQDIPVYCISLPMNSNEPKSEGSHEEEKKV